MNGMAYLAIGYAVIWVLLACYLFWIGRQQAALKRRVMDLEARGKSLDGAGRP
jgi:CcmD family protein